ncbi:MAG: MBL fold metallo-hydrolase [Actinomycetota bacterium]|nr:MBL fold metallo-hydrolase [Actinomycetota bacterium]
MPASNRRREQGRGERVLPGAWRLRLPLSLPGVPHCNAWALAHGDGIVLVDTGMHEPGSLAELERALGQVGLALGQVRLVVCTHAHADHYGQAGTVVDAIGCELWMHPDHAHTTAAAEDPDAALARRLEVARQSGVPPGPLERYAEVARGRGSGISRLVAPDRDLVAGVEVRSDLGAWTVHETPGHAPSHVCLFQAQRRMLISGDHLLGRVSLYFDYGWTPDPVGEFLGSLDRVGALDARLCLAGHARTFTDVAAHIAANRALVARRMGAVEQVLATHGPISAYDAVPLVYGEPITPHNAGWWLSETLCYLRHLQVIGRARQEEGDPERWRA